MTSRLDKRKAKYLNAFAHHLRTLREGKNLTQTELADLIGKDKQTIQKLESAKFNPSIYLIYEIAQGLDCAPSDLIDF